MAEKVKLTSMLLDVDDYTALKGRGYNISALCRKLMKEYRNELREKEARDADN